MLRAGCWSHLRTYFFDARHHHPIEAQLALGTLRDLFAIERSLVDATLDVRREVRNRDVRPLVKGFFDWIVALRRTVRPTSILGIDPWAYLADARAVRCTGGDGGVNRQFRPPALRAP